MKKFSITILIFLSTIMIACGASIPTETRPASESDAPSQARPTPTIENLPADPVEMPLPYPGLPPADTAPSEGYPVPQEFPTTDAYPVDEGTVWVLYPRGVQCEDASASTYQSNQDAKAGLTAAGITVHDVTTTELMVCSACGCPTSTHYRAEISESDLEKAISLGWEPE
jgi:hypothetical protein